MRAADIACGAEDDESGICCVTQVQNLCLGLGRMTSPREQYKARSAHLVVHQRAPHSPVLTTPRSPSLQAQRPDKMAATAALPGLFFCFVACLLLIFVSVSPPTWESVYFLNAGIGAGRVRFGVFGYTGSSTTVGYYFPASFGGFKSVVFSSFPSSFII